jgi:hypothetical protein
MRPLALVISPKIEEKLRAKHDIEPAEVTECFYNRTKGALIDTREEHKTKPPSEWFIAKKDKGRLLKVIFVPDKGQIFIKSCFDADKTSIRIYNKLAE